MGTSAQRNVNMNLSRLEYPAMLDSLQPAQATALLNDRVKHVGRLNSEIADWLQERRRIEELYATALRKLSQREPPSDASDLGIFTTPWQKVVSSAATIAESHRVLALKIESDIEKPLRDFTASSREVQSMSTMQGNLQSLAKDYENAQRKADKLKDKSGRGGATKVVSASSEMDNASSQWTSQAPYVFEALQALDESRCNHLRDVLTQFQTHEVDLVEKSRRTAENTLNSILNIETADEIRTFTIKNAGVAQSGIPPRADRRLSRSQQNTNLVPTISNSIPEDRASQKSASVHEEKKGRLGGLRRLGTVMRRKSTQPTAYTRTSTAGKPSASNFGASTMSNGEQSNLASDTTGPSSQGWRPPSTGFRPSSSVPDPKPTTPPAKITSPDEITSQSTSINRGFEQPNITVVNSSPHQSDLAQLQEPIGLSTPPISPPQETTRDAEGFTVPSTSMDPFSVAEQEAANNTDPSASQFKVDILNAPMTEERQNADSAMANMASTLRAQAAPPRRSSTNRGRRDVRNTVLLPTSEAVGPLFEQTASTSTFAPSASIGSTPFSPSLQSVQTPPASPPQPQQPSASEAYDAQSIRSSRSTATVGAGVRHPNLSNPGLNSSVIETVSVWLEKGKVTRSLVIGELALAYVAENSADLPQSILIRLDNFSALEKVAPNPAYVKQVGTQERAGEYTVDVGSLARTASSPTVAFKYQVHVSEKNLSDQAPIILMPSWKVEENQTSVILSYMVNPAFKSPISLSNVTLFIHLESDVDGNGKPSACQSKPAGTFSKERGMIYWRLDELLLNPDSPSQKVLARFATSGQAKPGKVEARWEIPGNSSSKLGLGSGLDVSQPENAGASSDPFADDTVVSGAWKSVGSFRKLVSGTYAAI